MLRLLLICWLAVLALPALAQNRHALVVGINAYEEIDVLTKALNDARAVAERLHERGFETDLLLDPDRRSLVLGLARLTGRITPGDEVVFYFAGHGVEFTGQHYLLPADVPAANELVVRAQSVLVADVIAEIQARGARVTILILDTCRDNPFQDPTLRRSIGRARGVGPIVAQPEGTFILFSAAAGASALDSLELRDRVTGSILQPDPDPNSVYTRALLPLLETPGLDIRQIASQVRHETLRLAQSIGAHQFPAHYDQLLGGFFFTPAVVEAPAPPERAQPAAAPDPCASARADWSVIEGTDNRSVLETYIDAHPACAVQLALARERLAALAPASVVLPEGAPDTGPAPASDPVPEIASLAPTATPAPASSSAVILREATIGNLASSAFSPDLRRVALGSSDSLVTVHDTHTGTLVHQFAPDQRWAGDILRLAFHPEGRQLAAAREDGRLTVWDLDTGVPVLEQDLGASALKSVAFSADGSALLLGLRPALMVALDIGTGEEIRSVGFDLGFAVEAVLRFEETPDGTGYAKLATSDRGERWVRVGLGSFFSGGGSGVVSTCSFFNRRPEDFALSADGRTHALAGPEGVHLCDNASNEAFFRFAIERGARHVRFDETGRRLAALDWNANLHLFEIDGPDTRHVLTKAIGRVTDGIFSADQFLATLQEEDRSVQLIRISLSNSTALSSTQSSSQNGHVP